MSFKDNPAWEADTHYIMQENQAEERHLVKLTLGRRLAKPGRNALSMAEKTGPHIYFDATWEELVFLSGKLHDQQVDYHMGVGEYFLYVVSRPLDNYRGIKSVHWGLFHPELVPAY